MATAGGFPLFICLHGGGGCPPAVNDEQWAQMQRYWLPCCPPAGAVYVACRGVSDSWKLHWEVRKPPSWPKSWANFSL